MSRVLIENIKLIRPEGGLIDGVILVENGKISSVSGETIAGWSGDRFDGRGSIAMPGFIDIHIHGANGADFMDNDSSAVQKIAETLPAEGTTAFLGTTITHSTERIAAAIQNGRDFMNSLDGAGAEMLGFHLEGPFIHPKKAGAQPVAFIQKPSIEQLTDWFGEEMADLKLVTMAPELDEEFKVIRELSERGVIVSAGHTTANYKTIKAAELAGLSHLTHYGNAMRGLHHREIGTVGAGMLSKDLVCEIIADGIHLSEEMLKLVLQVVGPERIILITDSMRAKGLPDGVYSLGDQDITVSGKVAKLTGDTIAGSVLKMNEGLRKLQQTANISWPEAVAISSSNAARRLGVYDRKGSIEPGKDADIVLVSEDFTVQHTFCRGELRYSCEK